MGWRGVGWGAASDFLSTLFLRFASHKVNHSKPVIQFPVSWSPKEYIFNLPVQHMFSGEGDFCHRDYFRAASKNTVCGYLTSERRNMQRTCIHALGSQNVPLQFQFFNISKCKVKQVALSRFILKIIYKINKYIYICYFFPTGQFNQITQRIWVPVLSVPFPQLDY